jgi:hypothetical protein
MMNEVGIFCIRGNKFIHLLVPMDKIMSALQQFISLVEGKNISWILSGSVSLALQ